MNTKLSGQHAEVEEITFAELTRLVKTELQSNPNSACEDIDKRYGISEATMCKLIHQITANQSSS